MNLAHPYDFLRSIIIPLKQIDDFIPQNGKVVELGCGQGVICNFLARNPNRLIIGVDIAPSRLSYTNFKNIKFIKADIRSYNATDASGIIISDVLHHLSKNDQKYLLAKLSRSLKKGRVLIIKEIDKAELIRSKLSRFWDFIFYPNDKIYYWNSKTLKNFLTKLGFEVLVIRASRLFPGSTTLYLCTKK